MTPKVYLVAVTLVGATLMLSVLGIVYLAADTAGPIPDVLQNIAVGSLTGLVGLLAVPPPPPGLAEELDRQDDAGRDEPHGAQDVDQVRQHGRAQDP